MDTRQLALRYQDLVKDIDVSTKAADDIAGYMKSLEANQIIRLSENFREFSSMDWFINWSGVDINLWEKIFPNRESYLWVLRLGTFHPNGYFREKCVRKLACDVDSMKFIILRINDWVKPVRDISTNIVLNNIPVMASDKIVVCLPYVKKIELGQRYESEITVKLHNIIEERMEEYFREIKLDSICKFDMCTRRYLYQILFKNKYLDKEGVNCILNNEKSSQCQFIIITMFLDNYDLTIEELDLYMNHKSKIVQRKALERKYDITKDYWDGLEKMLLSPSKSVREQTVYILNKHTNFDIIDYYMKNIDSSYKKICILGIGECGRSQDVEVLLRYLDDEQEGVVKYTLHSIGRLWNTKAGDIFWKYLQDDREVIQRAAYREISLYDIQYGAKNVYELFCETDSKELRVLLANQFRREGTWERLPYLLKLYNYSEEIPCQIIRRSIGFRSIYGKISKSRADEIWNILYDEKYGIPEKIRDEISFDLRFIVT